MMRAMGCHIDCNGTFITAGLLGQPPVLVKRLRYQVGECVAISECYRRLADSHPDVDTFLLRLSMDLGVFIEDLPKHPGWSNKMFVLSADVCTREYTIKSTIIVSCIAITANRSSPH